MSGRANSSNGASRLARIIARDTWFASGRPKAAAPAAPIPREPPFLPEDWRAESAIREATDALAAALRWRATIDVGDGALRDFTFCGPYADAYRRASLIFRKFDSLTLEPLPPGDEAFDARLSVTTKGKSHVELV